MVVLKVKRSLSVLVLFLISCITLYPLLFTFFSSYKSTLEIYSHPFALPNHWGLTNYITALFKSGIGRNILNSIMLSSSSVILLLIVASMASFALARMKFKWNMALYSIFLIGITIPVHSIIVPLFKMFNDLKMIDSYGTLILLYVSFHLPRTIFIVTGYMRGISKEIEESAVIDGCTTFQTFSKIVVPLSMPAIATSGILAFLYIYNDLLFALLFITSIEKHTIALGLMSFTSQFSTELGPVFAAIILCITPMLIVYLMFQQKIVSGISAGSVKA